MHVRGPSFERCHSEQGQQRLRNIVEMKLRIGPLPSFFVHSIAANFQVESAESKDNNVQPSTDGSQSLTGNLPCSTWTCPCTSGTCPREQSIASPSPRRSSYFEQLHAHASEHELQEECHEHDIADGLDGDDDALDDVLEEVWLDRD